MSFVTHAKKFDDPEKFRKAFFKLEDLREAKYSRVEVKQKGLEKEISSYVPRLKEKPLSKKERAWEWLLPLISSQARQKNLARFIGNFIEENKEQLSCADLEGEEKIEALQNEIGTLNVLAEHYGKYKSVCHIIKANKKILQTSLIAISTELDKSITTEKKNLEDLKEANKQEISDLEEQHEKILDLREEQFNEVREKKEKLIASMKFPRVVLDKLVADEADANLEKKKAKIRKIELRIKEPQPTLERLRRKVNKKQKKLDIARNKNNDQEDNTNPPSLYGQSIAGIERELGPVYSNDRLKEIVFLPSGSDGKTGAKEYAHRVKVKSLLEKLPASQEKMVCEDGIEREVYRIKINGKKLNLLIKAYYGLFPSFRANLKKWYKMYHLANNFGNHKMRRDLKDNLVKDFHNFIYSKNGPRITNILYFLNNLEHFQIDGKNSKHYTNMYQIVVEALFNHFKLISKREQFAALSREDLLQAFVAYHETHYFDHSELHLFEGLCEWAHKKSEKEGQEAFKLLFEKGEEEGSYSLWDCIRFNKISEKRFTTIYKRYADGINSCRETPYENAKEAYDDMCASSIELDNHPNSPRYADQFWDIIANNGEDLLAVNFSASLEDLETGIFTFHLPGLKFPKKEGGKEVKGSLVFEPVFQANDSEFVEGYHLKICTNLTILAAENAAVCLPSITIPQKEHTLAIKFTFKLDKEVNISSQLWTLDQIREYSSQGKFSFNLNLQKTGKGKG